MAKDVTSSGSARTSGVVLAKNSDNQDEAHDQLSEDDAGDIVDETINEAIAIKKKPSEKVDYMFLRRVKRSRRHTLERIVSMSKSTRNARTAQLYDLAELLSSQNHSQFIVIGISSNPDVDTISHEAYGNYAIEMLKSSKGLDFIQNFVSGWAIARSSYPSGVEQKQDSQRPSSVTSNNSLSEVVAGASAVVRKTAERFKKLQRFAPNHDRERIIDNVVDEAATRSESSDQGIRSDTQLSPVSPALVTSGSMSDEDSGPTVSDSTFDLVSNPIIVIDKETVQIESDGTPLILDSSLTVEDLLSMTEENFTLVLEQEENDASFVPAESNMLSDTATISADNVSISDIQNEVAEGNVNGKSKPKHSAAKRIKQTVTNTVELQRNRPNKKKKKRVQAEKKCICPKCLIDYDEDVKRGVVVDWVKCRKKKSCNVWAHVDCFGDKFICPSCMDC